MGKAGDLTALLALSQVTRVVWSTSVKNGNNGDIKLNPTALGCCKFSFIFQSLALRVVLPCQVSAHLPEEKISQQLLINLLKEIPIRRSWKKCAQ